LTKPVRRDELRGAVQAVLGAVSRANYTSRTMPVTHNCPAAASTRKIRILVAEDYPTNQQVVVRHLESAGYRVDLAENGRQAVEAYRREAHDLILMDIQMPEMDGYAATEAIRRIEGGGGRTPVVAMTAHAIKGYREKCLKAGMDDYITKPLRRKELLSMVRKWTAGPAGGRPGGPDGFQAADSTGCLHWFYVQDDAPMDFNRALDEFEGEREVLLEVVTGFVAHAQGQIACIRKAISDGDVGVVAKEAHALKGGAANLTAETLAAVALELEKAGKSQDLRDAQTLLERLAGELDRLDRFVQHIVPGSREEPPTPRDNNHVGNP
ncbi:MAG: response regulator, partial [Deltaproteobacteria bacterium]|nr:response regulator [Deltaproteobacteria bacterium]